MHEGLVQSLNKLREVSSDIYHKYVPMITSDTDIGTLATPIFEFPEVYNEFASGLINKIVYTQTISKTFRNPFSVLEGSQLPLGFAGESVYINPAKGRQYNAEDFAGLLMKYEIDAKVQYHTINVDVQYPVTFSRQQLKKAFTSWSDLETFIDGLSNSLYNGLYIDQYNRTKQLVAGAYKDNIARIDIVTDVTTEATAKAFVEKARELYLQFQTPSTSYNAWAKNDANNGRAVTTWTNPEDIVMIVRNDIRAKLDVEVMASAYNLDKATLLGNILTVNDFDIYNDDGTKNFDGSAIVGIIADKSWFQIKNQDRFMDSFYNANNRTMQFYLNDISMYNMSLFANGVILATEAPDTEITALSFNAPEGIVLTETGEVEGLDIIVTPHNANTPEIQYSSENNNVFTVTLDPNNNRHVYITAVGEGSTALKAVAGNVVTSVPVTVQTTVV